MRTAIVFLAGAAIGAASAIALTDRGLRELIEEGRLTVTGASDPPSRRGGTVSSIHINHPPPGEAPDFHPSMLAAAWQAGREGRRL